MVETVKNVFQFIISQALADGALINGDTVYCVQGNDAIYRANVTAIMSYSSADLIATISAWLQHGNTSVYGSTYSLDGGCPVYIASSSEPLCTDPTSPDNSSDTATILGGVVGTLAILLLLALVVGVVLGVLLWRLYRKRVRSWT